MQWHEIENNCPDCGSWLHPSDNGFCSSCESLKMTDDEYEKMQELFWKIKLFTFLRNLRIKKGIATVDYTRYQGEIEQRWTHAENSSTMVNFWETGSDKRKAKV